MKKFYCFWFVFCIGWGFLFSQPFDGFDPTLLEVPKMFVGGFLTIVMISTIVILTNKNTNYSRPSFELKPWQGYPVGLLVFVLATFMFSSLWGILLGVIGRGSLTIPLMIYGMASGGAFGGWVVLMLFRSRFST